MGDEVTIENVTYIAEVSVNAMTGSLNSLSDVDVGSATTGQVLTYNSSGGYWENTSLGAGSGGVDSINGVTGEVILDTDDIPEGINLYYTEERVEANANLSANTIHRDSDGKDHSDVILNNVFRENPSMIISAGKDLEWDGTTLNVVESLDVETYNASYTPDFNEGYIKEIELTGNITFNNPLNKKAGAEYKFIVKQDEVGNRTITFDNDYLFPGGTAPTLSTGANSIDILSFVCDGTSLYGDIIKNYPKRPVTILTHDTLSANLVSFYPFEIDADDIVGTNDLTVNGAISSSSGKIDNAYAFDGINDHITRGSMFPSYPLSVSAWAKPATFASTSHVISFGSDTYASNNPNLGFGIDGGFYTLFASANNGLGGNVVSAVSASTDWVFLTMVVSNAGNRKFYVNGNYIGENTTNLASPSLEGFSVGARNTYTGVQNYFDGIIDEVGIWNKALTSDEITDLYNSGSGIAYE